MPSIILPQDIQLHSAGPVKLVLRNGQPVLDQAVGYPQFFIKGEDVVACVEGCQRMKSRYGNRWPAQPTNEGLAWDPEWNAFGAFFSEERSYASGVDRLVEDVKAGKVHWHLCCPVVQGPESIIGQIMQEYGKSVGAEPGNRGFNPSHLMRSHPVETLLAKTALEELVAFRDRDRSLLDLAMENQLWDSAQWLWDRGVRPSEQALAGSYLESLVIASLALQESAVTGFLPGSVDRGQWLRAWLDRFTQTQTPITDTPFSTYRQRLMEKNAGSLYQDEPPVIDSIASLWISGCLLVQSNGAVPAINAIKSSEMFDAWVEFWAVHGVDMEAVKVCQWRKDPVIGVGAYMATRHRPELWAPWHDRLTTIYQATRMELDTVPASVRRNLPRL